MMRKSLKTKALSGAALALLLLAGCGTTDVAEVEATNPVGPLWIAEAVGGAALPNEPAVTLQFGADGRAAGKAGCNQYSGPYQLGDGTLSFGAMIATKMACDEPVMAIEQAYLHALAKVTHYQVRNESELLLLAADDSRIRLRREDAAP
jgi:heat shock protein HslJ